VSALVGLWRGKDNDAANLSFLLSAMSDLLRQSPLHFVSDQSIQAAHDY